MKQFTFTVELSGTGDTEEEAWADAVENFTADPGLPLITEGAEEVEEDAEEFMECGGCGHEEEGAFPGHACPQCGSTDLWHKPTPY